MDQPKRLGDYEVLDKLGAGGMGEVFRVRNVISDRIEAMKVLLPDLVGRQDLAARFLREIKVLAGLHHPNIAGLRTALTVDNQLVMIMELVEGQSLSTRLAQGPIPAGEALRIAGQVLDALDYAHGQQVIHRDIKPANMMLTPAGVVKLTDFGIARSTKDHALTTAGATTGSLSYISPEQISGAPPDTRSDLYSLGVSIYQMVTGKLPFEADNDFAVMYAHLQKTPVPPAELQPALSPEVSALILKAIAKDPAARFQSAAEFREAAQRVGGPAGPVAAGPVAAGRVEPAASAAPPPGVAPAIPSIPPLPVAAAMSQSSGPQDTAPLPGQAHRPPSAPVPPPRRVQGSVSPILYVALGAFLLVLVVAGIAYYSRLAEATPDESATPAPLAATPTPPAPVEPAPTTPAPPAEPTASATPAPPASAPGPAETPAVSPAPAPAAAQSQSQPARDRRPAGEPAAAVPADRASATTRRADAPAAVDGAAARAEAVRAEAVRAEAARAAAAAQLEETLDRLEGELDQLTANVSAVNGTLDRLKGEQARMGLGLRGDMAARQTTMNNNLARAAEALDRRDIARAERFKALAEADLDVLKKFIGR